MKKKKKKKFTERFASETADRSSYHLLTEKKQQASRQLRLIWEEHGLSHHIRSLGKSYQSKLGFWHPCAK